MNLRFDCVFHYVRDLQAAVRFYRDVLGLSLSSHDAIARFDIDGVLFELIPASEEAEFSGSGNARLCLKVGNLPEAAKGLRDKGVRIGEIQEVENGRLAPFQDPDGNELILWEYTLSEAA